MSEYQSVVGLMSKLREARAALHIFAKVADAFDGRPAETRVVSTVTADILVSDLRRARDILRQAYGQ